MKTNRYPGVKPFTENERHMFYGRNTDTKKLYQLINLEKMVLLYSKSGLGKSSLLNAGVLPLFEEAEEMETIKIRLGAFMEQSLPPVNTCLLKLPETVSCSLLDKIGAGMDTLWLRMKAIQHQHSKTPKTYILVFDQFEELFTYSEEDIKQFKKQLADLLYAKVPAYIGKSVTNRLREKPDFLSDEELEFLYRQPAVKVVMSIRSDRMSLLNNLADYLPDIQKNYYELKALDQHSAIECIVKPAMDKQDRYISPAFEYSSECIHKILDYLTQNGTKSIETFQLQTVCQYVENLANENRLRYDEKIQSLLAEPDILGDLQNIFRTQYDKLISNIETVEKQLAARLLIENKLIIDGNRVSLPDVVVLKEKGIDKALIHYLHDIHHILRSEPNTTGGISYEISHDTLVAPILKAKKEREDKEELTRLEAERAAEIQLQKEKAEIEKIELAKTRKRLRIVYGLLGLSIIAFIVSGYFYDKTTKQKRISQNLSLAVITKDHINKNPTLAYRLAELLWKNSISSTPSAEIQNIVSEAYYKFENPYYLYVQNLRHLDKVNSAEFSPDGKKIVTASEDGTAKIWDASTGKLLADLIGHKMFIFRAVFAPDGKKIVTVSGDSTARIWDVNSGKLLTILKNHNNYVNGVEFSPNGKKIVTTSGSIVKIWESSGKLFANLIGHHDFVASAKFSNDSKKIVTSSYDSTAIIWNASTGEKLAHLIGHKGELYNAVFSPDCTKVATVSADSTAKIWDTTGRLLYKLIGHKSLISSIAFSPDSTKIATSGADSVVKVWDAKSGKFLVNMSGHKNYIFTVAFSPNSKMILSASLDGTAKIWDVTTGKLNGDLLGHKMGVNSAIFSPNGEKALTASYDHTAKIWNIKDDEDPMSSIDIGYQKTFYRFNPPSASFSPDSKLILSTLPIDSLTAKIWDATTMKHLFDLRGYHNFLSSAEFSPNGKLILTAGDSTAKVWDVVSKKNLFDLKCHSYVSKAIFSIEGNKILTISLDSTIQIWNANSGNHLTTIRPEMNINKASFSEDGTKVMVLGDSIVKVFKTVNEKSSKIVFPMHKKIEDAVFSPDGKSIVISSISASYTQSVNIWNAISGDKKNDIIGNKRNVKNVSFSPDSKKIVTASEDATAKIWDASTGQLLVDLVGHSSSVNNAVFSSDGRQVLTASSDLTAKIWDASSGKLIADLAGGHIRKISDAKFSPDGNRVLTISSGGFAISWLTPKGIIEWIEKQKFYHMTEQDLKELGIDFIKLDK